MTELDTLKIPAFMRKRSLKRQASKKSSQLLLTALDRKKAGMGIEKRNGSVETKKETPRKSSTRNMWDIAIEEVNKKKPYGVQRAKLKKSVIANTPAKRQKVKQCNNSIVGIVTHFYQKISVAVIKLKSSLSVGDTITYQTQQGTHTQIVSSMEIDRRPIFTAKKGDEIGMKMGKNIDIGSTIQKGM